MTDMDFIHDQLPGRIVFGAGRRHGAPAEIGALDPTGVLIVGGSHDTEAITALIDGIDVPVETIIGVRPHVPAETRATRGGADNRLGIHKYFKKSLSYRLLIDPWGGRYND